MQKIERDEAQARQVLDRVRSARSVPEAFRSTVERLESKLALGEKVQGEWATHTFRELYERVRHTAAGLKGLGVERGSRVAIMSSNCVGWTVSDLAIQSLGAAVVPVFPTLGPEQVAHILRDSGAGVVVVEGPEQVAAVRGSGVEVSGVVVIRGPAAAENGSTLAEVERVGASKPDPYWEDEMLTLEREDLLTLMYTSGTSGRQKGVPLTHGNILANLEAIIEVVPIRTEDVSLSILPLAHVLERTASQFLNLIGGGTNYFAESIDAVPENLLEIRPTVVLAVPRLFERVFAMARTQAASNPRRAKIFEQAARIARRRYDAETGGERMNLAERVQFSLFDRVVYPKVREKLGGRVRFFVSGGARLEPDLGKFFYGAGVPVAEGYGLTETSPVVAVNRLDDIRFGTVGPPLPNVEVRFSEGNEILVRGPSIATGYHNLPEESGESFADGWFHTGDIGEFDEDGRLKITDRAKSILVLSTGKNVAPQPIETALASSAHITQAMLLGDGRKFVSALIVPDFEAARRTLGLPELSDEALCSDDRVRQLVESEVNAAAAPFTAHERPKKLELVPREWTEASGEMTPTLKLKANRILSDNEERVARIYAESR